MEDSGSFISEECVHLIHRLQQGDGHIIVSSLIQYFSLEINEAFLPRAQESANEFVRDDCVQLKLKGGHKEAFESFIFLMENE